MAGPDGQVRMAWARRREYFKGQGEGNAPTASKLYQVCHADMVLRFYFGELGANASHSCVFGPRAFACEDQGTIAAIIKAVVERCSDGLAIAELECGYSRDGLDTPCEIVTLSIRKE